MIFSKAIKKTNINNETVTYHGMNGGRRHMWHVRELQGFWHQKTIIRQLINISKKFV